MPRLPTHSPQLDLLGGADLRPAEIHRLFFALMPDAATRVQLAGAAAALKASRPALRARWVKPVRYHATLNFLGDYAGLRPEIVTAAKEAADSVRGTPFAWTLDYATSFRGHQPPCVLRSSAMPEPLQRLWTDLCLALTRAGLGGQTVRSFTPHVTLAYSHGLRLDDTPVQPIVWPAREIVLVHNLVGHGDYRVLARWTLGAG